MNYFGSLQNAVSYLFNGYPVRSMLLDNDPWFVARDIANILGYPDSSNMTRSLFSHQVSVISIKDVIFNVYDANTRQISSRHLMQETSQSLGQGFGGGNPNVNIISLGGLYALCNITRKKNAIIETFVKYIDEVILKTLWQRPDLVEQINELAMQRDEARSLSMMQHDELVDLRKRYNKQIDDNRMLSDIVCNPYDSGPYNMGDIFGALCAKKIEMCRVVNDNPRGINGLLDNNNWLVTIVDRGNSIHFKYSRKVISYAR